MRTPYTVIIPTRDRPNYVRGLLAKLLQQAPAPPEVIVVDQSAHSEQDQLTARAPIVQGHPCRLIYFHDTRIDGLAAARNVGLCMATSPYVIFLDDDALPDSRCLSLLVEALERNPRLLAVGGLVSNYSRPPLLVRLFRRIFYLGPLYDERQAIYWKANRYPPGQLIPTTKLNGGCMAFRRQTLVEAGGFDPRYRGASIAEDIEISHRLLRLSRRPDALALVGGALIHHASEGVWKSSSRALEYEIVATHYWFKKNHRWNLGNRLRFYWMCLGLLLWSAGSACKRHSAAPLKTFKAAVVSINQDYRNCPFLKEASEEGPRAPSRSSQG
jgi:GT2 family glycosyltransferase